MVSGYCGHGMQIQMCEKKSKSWDKTILRMKKIEGKKTYWNEPNTCCH